jgi:protein O-GlcNAc transferase
LPGCIFGAIRDMREHSALIQKGPISAPGIGAGGDVHRPLIEQGLAHHQRGERDLAESYYQRALAIEPNNPDAFHYLGILRHQDGRHSAAVDLIAKAIAARPNDAVACNNLGAVLEAVGKHEEAVDAYDQAVAIRPDYAEAWNNRGNTFLRLARPSEALESYDRALTVSPGYAEALNNRGVALHDLRRFAEAVSSFDHALKARPNYAEAFSNRGAALLALGNAAHALESFDRALGFNPDYAEALFNRGNALVGLKRYETAIASYDRATAIRPDYAKALNNRGNALKDQGRLEEAVTSYRQALIVKPDYADAHSNLLFAMHYMDGVSNADLLAEARRYGERCAVKEIPKTFLNDRSPTRRLRIGYVSGDFHSHPIGFFSSQVLETHSRSAFEIFCYSNNPKIDHVTNRLRAAADNWRTIADLSDDDAYELIARDRIDILIDLSGHTARNRLPVFALRAAPVQASWLGYPGTTGLPAIDYLIMDKFAVRSHEDHWYSEKVVRLPHSRYCYSPPNYAPPQVDPPSLRRGFVTFGSFNNIAKASLEVVKLWAGVLDAVPNSRMLFKWSSLDDAATRGRFSSALNAAGIQSKQLEFQQSSHHAELLTQYGEVDIALDTFPYGGGFTTCEAFWMGVPVVTLTGDRAASRHVLGAFYDLGLSDCVANSAREYVERASALARDPARLSSLRRSLRTSMAASPLADGRRFTPALELAYRLMWERWRRGESPAPLDIPESYAIARDNSRWVHHADDRQPQARMIDGGK